MATCRVLLLSAYLLQIAYSTCSWTVDGNTLDLISLRGETMTAKDAADHQYNWTICQNGVTCKSQNVMVSESHGTLCYILGQWDPAIQPKYEATNGGTWTFIYDNGDTDCGSPARTWSPKLVCSPGTQWASSMVTEATGSCYYEVQIMTQYACTRSYCSWTVGNKTLDLKCLQGEAMTAKDANGHQYSWTICRNGGTCKGQNAMVSQTAGDLCYILGQWDSAIQPKYEATNGGTWTFIYDNGDTDCGSPARTWSPKLVCSPGTHWASGIVTEVTGSCYYEVEIMTQYACTSSQYSGCVSK